MEDVGTKTWLTPREAGSIRCSCSEPHRRSVLAPAPQVIKQPPGEHSTVPTNSATLDHQNAEAPSSPIAGTKPDAAPPHPLKAIQTHNVDTASNRECPSCRKPTIFGRTCCEHCRRSGGVLHHHTCPYSQSRGELGSGNAAHSLSASAKASARAVDRARPTLPPSRKNSGTANSDLTVVRKN